MTLCNINTYTNGATSEPFELPDTLNIHTVTPEGTHIIASKLMDAVDWILNIFGLEQNVMLTNALYAVMVIIISLIVGAIVKWVLLTIVRKIADHTQIELIKRLRQGKFFTKLSRIIPALVFLAFMQFAFVVKDALSVFLSKCAWIYIVFATSIAINTIVYAVWSHIDERENKKRLPLKGLVQVVKGLLWIVAIIISIAIIVEKSPLSLLAGLGAFSAILMLVFKDNILGVVAGVQLSENDMLRVGDWIKVDGTTANGKVIEVSLTSVKVLNWDKTITTLPPYTLVSTSFQNFRNMQESGTRRIMRNYLIDADSVRMIDDRMIDEISDISMMRDYIRQKQSQFESGETQNVKNKAGLADGTIETNLGLFRAYVKMYLDRHPDINSEDTCFVNILEQSPNGIPLQVYCFTSTSEWIAYEGIQSEVFEHIAAMLPKFGLYTFENPSGRDSVNEGYLEAGGNPDDLYGLPFPFWKKRR